MKAISASPTAFCMGSLVASWNIIDAACEAWRKLIAEPHRITSIGLREWAHVGQTP